MTHEHGNEFQVRIEHAAEAEELSGWMNCQEEVIRAVTGLLRAPGKAYWLQVRNIRCLDCQHLEVTISEFPLNLTAAGNARFPRQADRRTSRSASSPACSAEA